MWKRVDFAKKRAIFLFTLYCLNLWFNRMCRFLCFSFVLLEWVVNFLCNFISISITSLLSFLTFCPRNNKYNQCLCASVVLPVALNINSNSSKPFTLTCYSSFHSTTNTLFCVFMTSPPSLMLFVFTLRRLWNHEAAIRHVCANILRMNSDIGLISASVSVLVAHCMSACHRCDTSKCLDVSLALIERDILSHGLVELRKTSAPIVSNKALNADTAVACTSGCVCAVEQAYGGWGSDESVWPSRSVEPGPYNQGAYT